MWLACTVSTQLQINCSHSRANTTRTCVLILKIKKVKCQYLLRKYEFLLDYMMITDMLAQMQWILLLFVCRHSWVNHWVFIPVSIERILTECYYMHSNQVSIVCVDVPSWPIDWLWTLHCRLKYWEIGKLNWMDCCA